MQRGTVLRRGVFLALTGSLLVLPSCAADSAYHPYRPLGFLGIGGDGTGYSESPVRPDVYMVGYYGSNNPTQCRYLATIRSAELALQQGKPYFEIIQAFPGESPATWALLERSATRPANESLAAVTIADGRRVDLDGLTSALLVHLSSERVATSLNAAEVLRQAQTKGFGLSFVAVTKAATQPGG